MSHSYSDGIDMENQTNDSEFRDTRSLGSVGRRSLSVSETINPQSHIDDNIESEIVAEAGDIGYRALNSNRYSESGRLHLLFDKDVTESGVTVSPLVEDALLQTYGFWSRDPMVSNIVSPVSPLASEIISPPIQQAGDKTKETKKELSWWSLEYVSCLIHLAFFGILGVLTRYLLQKLFGPGVVGVTSDRSILYLDLPSNMVGSFLMGWLGVVFKSDISRVSDLLAIGLTTGYLGSLTTFSGWNQKMLDLSVKGHWVLSSLGFVIGLSLAAISIIFGVDSAKISKSLLGRRKPTSISGISYSSCTRHMVVMVVLLSMVGLLYGVSVVLEKRKFDSGGSEAELWLACMVAPLGVWIRWSLAPLNGRGLGRARLLKWVPFGTLIANVSACCVMAALATVKKAVNSKSCDTVATGLQFGLMGCLSTVSTFIAEFHAMRESSHIWRAYAYAAFTIVASFSLGTFFYSLPVWTQGYK